MIWSPFGWLAVLNTLVLLATILLAGIALPLGSLPWLVLGALLISVVLTLIDAVLGFDRPGLDPDHGERAIWRSLDRLPIRRRNRLIENLRLLQLYEVFWSYGLELVVGGTSIQRIRASAARWITGRDSALDHMNSPQKVRAMLEQLGPLYVKLGQIVSSQGAALPEEWRVELDKLQSMVTPFPYVEAREIIRAELGAPPERLFASFDHEPLAAASTAQVHCAILHEGTQVVVKVQRPNINAKVRTDLRIMREVTARLERRFVWARELALSGIVGEYATGVMRELNYHNEIYHGVRLADTMATVPGVHVPRVYRELSTSKVLTMEFVRGIKVNRLGEPGSAGLDRAALARIFLRAMVKQLLIDGFFHADPHPGNLYVDPQMGTISFLDLGMMGELSGEQRRDLLELLFALQEEDTVSLAQVLRRLSRATRPIDEAELARVVARVYSQEWKYGATSTFGTLMTTMLNEMSRCGLRLNEGLTLAIKALMQAEEAVSALAPDVDVFQLITSEAKSLLGDQLTPARIVDALETQLRRSGKELARRLPSLADATLLWLDQYQRGKLGVELDTGELPQQIGQLSRTLAAGLRHLAVGLALCGMVIGSAIGAVLLRSLEGAWAYLHGAVVLAFLAVLLFSAVIVTLMLSSANRRGDESGAD